MKTSPLAVAMLPPMFRMPLLRPTSPSSTSSSLIPNGTVHAIAPVFTFTAVNAPYGGAMHDTLLPLVACNIDIGTNLNSFAHIAVPPSNRLGIPVALTDVLHQLSI